MSDTVNMSTMVSFPRQTGTFPAAALTATADNRPAGWKSAAIADCTGRLTLIFALLRELLRTEAAWLAGVPYWDAKQAIARHVLEDARYAEAVLTRLHELKATSAEHRQIAGLEEFVRAIASARQGDEWLRGLYTQIKPWLAGLIEQYLAVSDPVMDEPTRLILADTLAAQRRQTAWFAVYRPRFSSWEQPDTSRWCDHVQACQRAASLLFPAACRCTM